MKSLPFAAAPTLLLRWLAGAAVLFFAAASARADSVDLGPYKDDIRLLDGKIIQHKYELKHSDEGQSQLDDLESGLTRLKDLLSQMEDVAGDIDTADSHLKYLQDVELDSKQREVERVRTMFNQQLDNINQRVEGVQQQIDAHNARPPNQEDSGAVAAYNAEANDLNSRKGSLSGEFDRIRNEAEAAIDKAVAAYSAVQKDYEEENTKREKLASQLQDLTQQYSDTRGQMVEKITAIESAPAPSGRLTPFPSGGVPPENAGLTPRVPQDSGPGTNPRAIDQLLLVTSASRQAAAGNGEAAKGNAENRFDTPEGPPPASLPDVPTPEGKPVEPAPIPLVVDPSPTEQPDAPPEVKQNPKLQAIAQQQSQQFQELQQLYDQRRELFQQGASASPEQLTKVIDDISSKQAEINYSEAMKKMSAGSIDLTIRPKSQTKKISDIAVPPPATSPPGPAPDNQKPDNPAPGNPDQDNQGQNNQHQEGQSPDNQNSPNQN